jgi:glutaredoxin 3
MKSIKMYTSAYCPYCLNAEKLLSKKGITDIKKIRVDGDSAILQEMIEKTGRRTVPQIFIGHYHVGGFDDLRALDLEGKLDSLLGIS